MVLFESEFKFLYKELSSKTEIKFIKVTDSKN